MADSGWELEGDEEGGMARMRSYMMKKGSCALEKTNPRTIIDFEKCEGYLLTLVSI